MPDPETRVIVGGVDTHKDAHVTAVIDETGRLLATQAFPTTAHGYAALIAWMRTFGLLAQVGVEDTSSYGAGLTRALYAAHLAVVEVHRPNRQVRRRRGKSDSVDAEAAARTALAQRIPSIPKSQDGAVEMLRLLHLQRRSSARVTTRCNE